MNREAIAAALSAIVDEEVSDVVFAEAVDVVAGVLGVEE